MADTPLDAGLRWKPRDQRIGQSPGVDDMHVGTGIEAEETDVSSKRDRHTQPPGLLSFNSPRVIGDRDVLKRSQKTRIWIVVGALVGNSVRIHQRPAVGTRGRRA